MILSIVIYPSNMFICLSPWPDQTMFDDFFEFLSQGAGPVRHVIGRDPRLNGRTRVFSGGCSTSRNGQNSSTVGEFCPRIWWRWHNLNISQLYSYSMYRCGKLQGGPRHINFDLLCWWLFFFVQNHPMPDDPNRLLDVLKPRDKIKERRYVWRVYCPNPILEWPPTTFFFVFTHPDSQCDVHAACWCLLQGTWNMDILKRLAPEVWVGKVL